MSCSRLHMLPPVGLIMYWTASDGRVGFFPTSDLVAFLFTSVVFKFYYGILTEIIIQTRPNLCIY